MLSFITLQKAIMTTRSMTRAPLSTLTSLGPTLYWKQLVNMTFVSTMCRLTKSMGICLCVKICQVMEKVQVRSLQLKPSTIQARLTHQQRQLQTWSSKLGFALLAWKRRFLTVQTTMVLTSILRSSFRAKSPISWVVSSQNSMVRVRMSVTGSIPMTILQVFGQFWPKVKSVKPTWLVRMARRTTRKCWNSSSRRWGNQLMLMIMWRTELVTTFAMQLTLASFVMN